MKRFILLATMFAVVLGVSAQRRMQVWEGNTYMQFFTTDVDSVTFLQFPDGILQECEEIHDTIIKTITVRDTVTLTVRDTITKTITVHDTITQIVKDTVYIQYCPDTVSDKPLVGAFSVSATKQVRFSRGNLQYTQSTQTWSFAKHQYDMIGEANVSGSSLADKIDLFGWSGDFISSTPWGISASTIYTVYRGNFVDWGTNIGDGKTWYTLTDEEWKYLLHHNGGCGVARINLNTDGTEYVNGLILLPDTWTCPEGMTFNGGVSKTNSIQAYADHQTFTRADWQKLESAGAVFLPASGHRDGSNVNDVQDYSLYWSATPSGRDRAYFLYFRSSEVNTDFLLLRYVGRAVRLVQDL